MASLKQEAPGLWRLRYSVTWTDGKKKPARVKRKKEQAQLLESFDLAKKLEEATAIRRATNAEIDLWVQKELLPLEWAREIFDGYGDTIQRQTKRVGVDFDVLESKFEDFMLAAEKAADASRETHYNHMNMYRQVAKWLKQHHPTLVTLTKDDVIDYKNSLKTEAHLAESTINNRMQKLKYLLEIAVKQGYVATNAYVESGLKRKKAKKKKRRRVFSESEIKLILAILLERAEFYADRRIMNGCFPIACFLGYFAGLRNEEIRWLSWDAISLEEDTLTIEATECRATGRKWDSKTIAFRTLGLSDTLRARLINEKDRQGREGILGQFVIVGGGYRASKTYASGHGRKGTRKVSCYESVVDPKKIQRIFNEFLKREGLDKTLVLPKPTFYSLRHTFATMLLRGGTDIVTVQHRMGHEEIETTMEYTAYVNPRESRVENSLPH